MQWWIWRTEAWCISTKVSKKEQLPRMCRCSAFRVAVHKISYHNVYRPGRQAGEPMVCFPFMNLDGLLETTQPNPQKSVSGSGEESGLGPCLVVIWCWSSAPPGSIKESLNRQWHQMEVKTIFAHCSLLVVHIDYLADGLREFTPPTCILCLVITLQWAGGSHINYL